MKEWGDRIWELTPVEQKAGLWFKRDDLFAPLGQGGINGSKLRQCIWLIDHAESYGYPGLVSGASVKSPQLMMTSAVAHHYGIKSHHVIGASKPETMRNNLSVDIAMDYGATFTIIKIGYNPNLQRKVQELLASEYKGWWHLEYGISLDHKTNPGGMIEQFHRTGARQVANLPEEMETLVIPTGSANSAVSIMYGLALHPPKNLKRVVLIGIGPPKKKWIEERLRIISSFLTNDTFIDMPSVHRKYSWEYWDLHSYGIYTYADEVNFRWDDIVMHPTYEGKIMAYLTQKLPQHMKPTTLVWIVGGQVDRDFMKKAAASQV